MVVFMVGLVLDGFIMCKVRCIGFLICLVGILYFGIVIVLVCLK